MPISIVGATQASRSGSIITLPVPTGVQNGDLLLVGVHQDSGTETALTPPTGWTKRNFWSLTGGHGLHVYWRVANSEPASYTWTDSVAAVAFCLAIRGQDSTTPFDVADGAPAQANSSSIATNSITTQTAGALLVGIAVQNHGAATSFTPPSGFTEQSDASIGWAAITCATSTATTTGSKGPFTFVCATQNNSAGWLTAIRPSSVATLSMQNASAGATGSNVAVVQTQPLSVQAASNSATASNVALTQSAPRTAPTVVGVRYNGKYEGTTTSSYSFNLNQTVPAGRYLFIQCWTKPLLNGAAPAEARTYATGLRLRINRNGRPLKILGHVAQTNSVEEFFWLWKCEEDILTTDTIQIVAKGSWNTDAWVVIVHELQAGSGNIIVPVYMKELDEDGTMPNASPKVRAEPLPANIPRLWLHALGYRETLKTLTADSRFASTMVSNGTTSKTPNTENIAVHTGYYSGTDTDVYLTETLSASVWWESVLIALEEVPDPGSVPYPIGLHGTFYTKIDEDGNAYTTGDVKVEDGKTGDLLIVTLSTDDGTNLDPPAGLALLAKSNSGGCSHYVWMRRYTDVPELSGSGQPEKYNVGQLYLGSGSIWTARAIRFPNNPWTIRASGTATGGSTTSLSDSGANFVAAGVAAGDYVELGTNAAMTALVASVSATGLTFSQTLPSAVTSGTAYIIRKNPAVGYVTPDSTNPRTWPQQAPSSAPQMYLGGAFADTPIGQDDNAWSEAPTLGIGSFMDVENGAFWSNVKGFYGWVTNTNPVNASVTFQPGRDQNNPGGTPTPTDGPGHTWLVFLKSSDVGALGAQAGTNAASGAAISLAQTHNLSGQPISVPSLSTALALGQSHLLSSQGATQTLSSIDPALNQNQLLAPQSVSLAAQGADAALTPGLILEGANLTAAASGISLSQSHFLGAQASSAGAAAAAAGIFQNHSLLADSALAYGLASDSALDQGHLLSVQSGAAASACTDIALLQDQALQGQPSNVPSQANPIALNPGLNLQSAQFAFAGINVNLNQNQLLSVQGVSWSVLSGDISLNPDITPQNAAYSASTNAVALSQQHSLLATGASSANAADSVALGQVQALSGQNALQSASALDVFLGQTHILSPQAGAIASLASDISLQSSNCAPQSANVAASTSNVALSQQALLGNLGISVTSVASSVALNQNLALSIQPASLGYQSSAMGLSHSHNLFIQSSSIQPQATVLALSQNLNLSVQPGSISILGSDLALFSGTVYRSGVSIRLAQSPYGIRPSEGLYSISLKEE